MNEVVTSGIDRNIAEEIEGALTAKRNWRRLFLDKLAETSNVSAAADAAGVHTDRVYRLRRNDPEFAADWKRSLIEGYEHLELETLFRLRNGIGKDDPKFDLANALRLLGMHRDTVAGADRKSDRNESEILASIDAKIERMQAREKNVTRLLRQDGVRTPKTHGRND